MRRAGIYVSIVLIYALWFYICYKSVIHNSQTFDESVHITAGAFILKKGYYGFNINAHPPLSEVFEALPLLFMNIFFPVDYNLSKYQYADLFMFENTVSHESILYSARFMNVFAGFLLSVLVFIVALRISMNVYSAIFATAFFLFNPNIIAHTTLATTDIMTALTTFSTFSFMYFMKEKFLHAFILGILITLMLSSKYPLIVFLPVVAIFLYLRLRNFERFMYMFIVMLAGIVAGFIVLYGSNIDMYINGVLKVIYMHGDVSARNSILFDNRSVTGFWYYFIAGLFLKNPVEFLIIFFYSLFYFRGLGAIFYLPPLIWFLLISYGNVHIGFRYAILIYPFVSIASIFAFRKNLLKILALIQIFESLILTPHFISYFFPLIKDEKKFIYMTDSNLDWGQGLVELKKIDKPMLIVYFGTSRPQHYGLKVIPLEETFSNLFVKKTTLEKPEYFVISATQLAGTYIPFKDKYRFLREIKPVYIICDGSIFVYKYEDVAGHLQWR